MTTPDQNMVFPPYAEVCFCFKTETLLKLPSFLFLSLLLETRPHANNDEEFKKLKYQADKLPYNQSDQEILSLIGRG